VSGPRLGSICAAAMLAAVTFTAVLAANGEAGVRLKVGGGRELTSSRCIICHSLEYIPANAPAMDRAGWQKTVQKMRDRFGAPISDTDAQTILDYLDTNYSGKT
jgi:sulfite dehydrogenase (cytochrome) subunit B